MSSEEKILINRVWLLSYMLCYCMKDLDPLKSSDQDGINQICRTYFISYFILNIKVGRTYIEEWVYVKELE